MTTGRPARFTEVPLPPYSFVPGQAPHPRTSPEGHSRGRPEPVADAGPETAWRTCAAWLAGADLYNFGFFWESHEAWEALWHAHGRRGVQADFLKAMIQTAAAHVKIAQRNPTGVRILSEKSRAVLQAIRSDEGRDFMGLDLDRFLARHRRYFEPAAVGEEAPAEAFPWLELPVPR